MFSSNTETGITVTYQDADNTIDVAIDAAQTAITSVVNTSLEIGRDADNRIKFGTDNQIIFEVSGGDNVIFKASGEIEATSLDISGDADIDGTLEADAITVNGTALNTVIAGVTVANATLAATTTVANSTANTNFPVVFHDESNGLLDDTGALRYNPSTGELLVPKLTVAGTTTTVDTVTMNAQNAIIFEGATADSNETTLTIIDPTSDHTINLPNLSGTIPLLATVSTTQISSTPEELNILDGATVVVGEINALDLGSTAVGTAIASKAMILDSNKDYTGVRNFTLSGELDAGSLDISGDADIDGTLEADAITVGGTALNTVIAGVTVTNATTAAVATTVTISDNESTNEENAVVFTAGGDVDGGNIGLESDGDLTYNPSTGTVSATVFKGNIDAVDGDFDGTLEADAITVAGTALATVIAGTTVTDATNSAHVLVTDNESTNEENLITFVEGATSSTGNVGLEMDGNLNI
jgi:cytoskeletal protein CcmA (bactofilin family)